MYDYPVDLTEEEGTVLASVPDVRGCHTFGDDPADALVHAADALEAVFLGLMTLKQDIPTPSPARGRPTVRLMLQSALKASLYQAMRDRGVRKVDLMRRLGWKGPQVDRLLSLNHASRLFQIEAAAAALGIRFDVDITDVDPKRRRRTRAPRGAKKPLRRKVAEAAE